MAALPLRLVSMPDMDMDETINSDEPFEDALAALLKAGKAEEPEEQPKES